MKWILRRYGVYKLGERSLSKMTIQRRCLEHGDCRMCRLVLVPIACTRHHRLREVQVREAQKWMQGPALLRV